MNCKHKIAVLCMLVLLLGLTGCGADSTAEMKQETAPSTAPVTEAPTTEETVSPDTLLAMELVEQYLDMEKPQHESIQTRFGLVTKEKKRPIVCYDDYSYAESGEVFWQRDMYDVGTSDSDLLEDYEFSYYYEHPELAVWLGEDMDADWLKNQTYYILNSNGEIAMYNYGYYSDVNYQPIQNGFSYLPKKSYMGFLRDALSDPSHAAEIFTLSEGIPSNMEAKQEIASQYFAQAWKKGYSDTEMEEAAPAQPCRIVSYDVPAEYLNVYNPQLMNVVFYQYQSAFHSQAECLAMDIPRTYESTHPVNARLQSGPIHVSLYFDKETGDCIGEKLDLTDCSQKLMDQLCALPHVEAGDRSFIIEKQYFDNSFRAIPACVQHQDPAQQQKNQAVFWTACAPGYANSTHHQIFATTNFGLQFNPETQLFEITEGNDLIASLMRYDAFDGKLDTETMVESSETLTSKTGLTYTIHQVPMGKLFGEQDPNPSEIGYMVTCFEEGINAQRGILISAWDRDTAVRIMDDMTLTTAELPKLWKW